MYEISIHVVCVVGVAASSVSLILIHQLEDKLKAHDLYLSFLKNVDLWSRVYRSVFVIRTGPYVEDLSFIFLVHVWLLVSE